MATAKKTAKKKSKVDVEALQSPFMRIPRMDIMAARSLLDMGIRNVYELQGRSPEALFDEALKRNPSAPRRVLYALRLAVYFAETENPERRLLNIESWAD